MRSGLMRYPNEDVEKLLTAEGVENGRRGRGELLTAKAAKRSRRGREEELLTAKAAKRSREEREVGLDSTRTGARVVSLSL